MTLYEAMIASGHIDEDGMVLEDPNAGEGPNTGNGWHGWGVLSCLASIRGEVREQMKADFHVAYMASVVNGHPGLVHRGPRKREELIAHDDMIGISVASKAIDNGLTAALVLAHLKKRAGSYNNLEPDKWTLRSFQVRHMNVLPTLYGACNLELGCLESSLAIINFISGSLSSSPRGRILDWMCYRMLTDTTNKSVLRAMEDWKSGLFKVYSKGMRDVFAEYYGVDHPFVEYGVGC